MRDSSITKCQQALHLNIVDGLTETEATDKVDISASVLIKYKKTEEGQQFITDLKEKVKQKLLESVKDDESRAEFLKQLKTDMNNNRGCNLPV